MRGNTVVGTCIRNMGKEKSRTTGEGEIPRATTLMASGDTWEVAIKPLMVTELLANSTKSMVLYD
jgi:hypothetical protein